MVRSLREQCVAIIACQMSWVESLEGFPSLIGQELWEAYLRSGCSHYNNSRKCPINSDLQRVIGIFLEAYGPDFLSSVKLSRLQVINNYETEINLLLTYVTDLDLSGCQLGDYHDLLYHIGKDLKVLNNLDLTCNKLTNRGLRSLFGIDCTGCTSLANLTAKDNLGITHEGLKKFALPSNSLKSVTVSAVSRSDASTFARNIESATFYISGKPACYKQRSRLLLDHRSISNVGWASQMIEDWNREDRERMTQKQAKAEKMLAGKTWSFYGKKIPNVSDCQRGVETAKAAFTLTFVKLPLPDKRLQSPPRKKAKLTISDAADDDEFDSILENYL